MVAGNHEKLPARAAAVVCRRALRLLPAAHGPVTFRIGSAYYAVALLAALRKAQARFTVSVPRTSAMSSALSRIPDKAWQPATDIPGAEVAETTYTPEGWRHEPLPQPMRPGSPCASSSPPPSDSSFGRSIPHPRHG